MSKWFMSYPAFYDHYLDSLEYLNKKIDLPILSSVRVPAYEATLILRLMCLVIYLQTILCC